MPVDVRHAELFVYNHARVLDRHQWAVLVHDAPVEPVLAALRAYRNPDGGFGHALEPDVRGPDSQPASTLHALEVLAQVGAMGDPMVADAAAWVAAISEPDGGVPTVLPSALDYPHAPWMTPSPGGGFLTFALAARFWNAGSDHPWLDRATDWCWTALDADDAVGGYTVKFALDFLDAVPEAERAAAAIDRLRPALRPDGSIPVPGGTQDEQLTPLDLAPRPGAPSRALFTPEQIESDLDRLEQGQLADGGWDVDYLHWSPAQALDARSAATLHAVVTLQANGRLVLSPA